MAVLTDGAVASPGKAGAGDSGKLTCDRAAVESDARSGRRRAAPPGKPRIADLNIDYCTQHNINFTKHRMPF